MRTRVKICGVMRVEDARAAARLGADAVGLIFCRHARRYVKIERAREIVSTLPAYVTPVGVFVDDAAQRILDLAAELNLRTVQLHGDETPDEIADLAGLSVIKAISVERATISADLRRWRDVIEKDGLKHLAGILLETSGGAEAGGTGTANDWPLIRDLQSHGEFAGLPPLILAGGLTPETVGPVARDLRPWAVDISSGVESEFGIKSEEKIAAFIHAVREADGV